MNAKRKAEWEEKCWGRVQHLFVNPHVAVSHLELIAGRRCSLHRHSERANLFCVHEGAVAVVEMCDCGRESCTLLQAGESHVVPSGVWHRFRVLTGGRMTEIYWPDRGGSVRLDDIERDDVGGEDDVEGLREELFRLGLL